MSHLNQSPEIAGEMLFDRPTLWGMMAIQYTCALLFLNGIATL